MGILFVDNWLLFYVCTVDAPSSLGINANFPILYFFVFVGSLPRAPGPEL